MDTKIYYKTMMDKEILQKIIRYDMDKDEEDIIKIEKEIKKCKIEIKEKLT